jgi:hypothetical protein
MRLSGSQMPRRKVLTGLLSVEKVCVRMNDEMKLVSRASLMGGLKSDICTPSFICGLCA